MLQGGAAFRVKRR